MKARRNYKDTLFRMIFSDRESLLGLYNAVNGTDYHDADDLEITTLENAVYMNMKNDVSFVFDFSLNLYEHQSTANPNMPLRDLFYVSDLLQNIVKDKDLYGTALVKIPAPRFVVFYNGAAEQPEQKELRLSEAFLQDTGRPELELLVTVLNINPGKNEALMESCTPLKEYMLYVEKVRGHLSEYSLEKAVNLAVDECISEGILAEFLSRNKAEAIAMSIYEYDEEKHLKNLFEEGKAAGMLEGKAAGMLEGKAAGKAEDIMELLKDFGTVPQVIKNRIYQERDIAMLGKWLKAAARASSVEEFEAEAFGKQAL